MRRGTINAKGVGLTHIWGIRYLRFSFPRSVNDTPITTFESRYHSVFQFGSQVPSIQSRKRPKGNNIFFSNRNLTHNNQTLKSREKNTEFISKTYFSKQSKQALLRATAQSKRRLYVAQNIFFILTSFQNFMRPAKFKQNYVSLILFKRAE